MFALGQLVSVCVCLGINHCIIIRVTMHGLCHCIMLYLLLMVYYVQGSQRRRKTVFYTK